MFSKFGILEVMVSDNGLQFGSTPFQQFALDYGFQYCTSNPHFPQEIGCAKRAVDRQATVIPRRCVFGIDTYKASPLDTTGCSPVQLLMGRQIRTRFPIIKSKLILQWPDFQKVAESDDRVKAASAHSYDSHHGARALPSVRVESPVLMKSDGVNKWERYSTKVGIDLTW